MKPSLFATSVFLCILCASINAHAEEPATDTTKSFKELAQKLYQEGKQLRSEADTFRSENRSLTAPDFKGRAEEFRKRLGEAVRKGMPLRLNAQLVAATTDSYSLSLCTEWTNFESGADGLRWWSDIYGQVPTDRFQQPESVMQTLAWTFLATWAEAEPRKVITVTNELDARFSSAKPSIADMWAFSKSICLKKAARALGADEESLAEVEKAQMSLWKDEEVAFDIRTDSVAEHARTLYGRGEAERAALLLSSWETTHKGNKLSNSFYNVRFYVYLFGIGDLSTAAASAKMLAERQTPPSLSLNDSTFCVLDAYYANIGLPTMELKRRAKLTNKEKIEKKGKQNEN